MKNLLLILVFYSGFVHSADIGFGRVYAIKSYDFSSYKAIRVYLETDAGRVTEACKNERGFIEAELTFSKHSKEFVDRTLSIALSAYHSGKKIRLYSTGSACEIDFIAIEETYL